LTSKDLLAMHSNLSGYEWVAASCHSLEELQFAARVGVDFVVLAPVLETKSHPHAVGMGWERFAELVAAINIPVFALGGMAMADLNTAAIAGAQGVAGISAFVALDSV
jgi:8-oxo-dGTP diphosphatase